MRFWLGGYTADMDGDARGIGALQAGEADGSSAGGSLSYVSDAAATTSPSWVAQHPTLDIVYATLEAAGTVAAFRRTGEAALAPLGRPVDAGAAVCHAVVAPDGGSLIASCWGDGRVVRIGLDAAGRPSAPVPADAAADPHAGPVDPFARAGEAGPYGAGDRFGSGGEYGSGVDGNGAHAEAIESELAAARSLRAAVGDEFARFVPGYDIDPAAAFADAVAGAKSLGRADSADAAADAAADAVAGAKSLGRADSANADADADAASLPERVSRAHSAVLLPDGRVATADLGFDLVRIWRPGAAGLRLDHEVVLPFETGPRHMVLHPSGHLHVVTEFSCEVFTLGAGRDGRWRLLGGVPAAPGMGAGDSAAELTRSRDGDFLYAGLRGSNTIAVLRVRGAGERIEPVALVDAGVDWPRHHLVVRDTLLVAGQRSNEVVSLTLDMRTGVPGRVRSRTDAPSPTCILPARS